jgi:hypothetical protein
MRGRLALVLVLLGLIAPSIGGAPAIAQEYRTGDEARVVSLVNGTRSGKGLQRLSTHAGLVNMAREQAVRMLQKGNIFHNSNLGADIQALNVIWKIVGENVGMGPNVDVIEQAFLGSPHHYENIVRPNFNSIGVGVVPDAKGGVFVTQVFAEIQGAAAAPPARDPDPIPAPVRTVPPAPPPTAPPTAPPTPMPTPTPTPIRPDPNAVKGGLTPGDPFPVLPLAPASVAAEDSKSLWESFVGGLRHVADTVGFWA